MSDKCKECVEFFSTVPAIFRPTNLRSALRTGKLLVFSLKDKSHQLDLEEKTWLLRENSEQNAEWPLCLQGCRNTSKKGLIARYGIYKSFFKRNSTDKPIVARQGRREKIDKPGLVAVAAAFSELHSAGREMGLVKLKEIMRTETEQSAMRSGRAIDLAQLSINGPTKKYINHFIQRHDLKVKSGDMNTVNRNTRMSCPRGCFASYILYYAYHGYSPSWSIFTEDAMTCVFAPLKSGAQVCRLVNDSEFEQYMKLVAHTEVEGALYNVEGYPVDANGIVVCNLKLPTHTRHSEQHLHLPFAIKTLWLFSGNGDNGDCTFSYAIPSMPDGEFLCVEVVGLSWTGEIGAIGYVYFSKTRSTVQVAEHWKLYVRNKFIAKSNLVNKIHEKKVFVCSIIYFLYLFVRKNE